jgi:hypothetical protein
MDRALKVGDMVTMVMLDGKERPAICVNTFSAEMGNFSVFVDGSNDGAVVVQAGVNTYLCNQWYTSVSYADKGECGKYPNRSWHYPESN